MAALRALLNFYEVEIPLETLPTLALGAERDELDITAGFMDRVVQAYEGCIYMDLQERYIQETGHGRYERMDASLLPPLYLAYKPSLGKVSGRVLSEIRIRYDQGDTRVRETLARIAGLAEKGREALERRNTAELKILMDENFDLRRTIMTISPANLEMIAAARACGASAKFAGSGGSLIGVYDGEGMFDRLCAGLTPLGVIVVKPEIY
jgi:glucuronokinase